MALHIDLDTFFFFFLEDCCFSALPVNAVTLPNPRTVQ